MPTFHLTSYLYTVIMHIMMLLFPSLVPEISLESAKFKVYETDLYISVCVELKSDLKRDIYVILEVYGDTATGKLTIIISDI